MTVLVGALAPEGVQITIANADLEPAPLDLSTVTALAFDVTTPTKRMTWVPSITSQTSTEIVAEYQFAAGDTGEAADYRIMAVMTVPGGTRRAGPTVLQVRE